jgi:hypothetical protein
MKMILKMIFPLLLLATLLAQDTKPTTPVIPPGYQTQFQALIVQQKNLQLQEVDLINKYKKNRDDLAAINKEGTDLQDKVLKELGLDPKKYVVQGNDKGYVEIQAVPEEKTVSKP